jgi:hypothetical protein
MITAHLRTWMPLAALMVVTALNGCGPSPHVSDDVPDIIRGYKPHVEQVLDNIAAFTKDPGAWPSHVLIYRGAFETRRQWTGAVGTSTKLENTIYGMTRWELASLDDPYDIMRVRLLYKWQVGNITFDELDKQWNEIRDRPVLDGGGKPILGPDGKPKFDVLPLPITRETKRDWTADSGWMPLGSWVGRSGPIGAPGTKTIWVIDTEAASQFSIAILSAMANSRVKARWGDASMMTP